jgi:hypothetical protein
VIGDEAMHRIERDLDLEESRLEACDRRTTSGQGPYAAACKSA